MTFRWVFAAAFVVALVFSATAVAPAQAQAKRVIRVVATSYKYEPNLIQVRQGETVGG